MVNLTNQFQLGKLFKIQKSIFILIIQFEFHPKQRFHIINNVLNSAAITYNYSLCLVLIQEQW